MSSYAHVFVCGREVMSFRNGVEPTFMFLFRADDLVRTVRTGTDRPSLGYSADEEYEACEFVVPSREIRDRLDLLGIGRAVAAEHFREIVEHQLELHSRTPFTLPESLIQFYKEESELLRSLSYDAWLGCVRDSVAGPDRDGGRLDIGSLRWLTELWEYVDSRVTLRAFADAFPDDLVTLDVTDLEGGGWLEPGVAPQEAAIQNFSWAIANGAPAIVLAEGRTDISVLQEALLVRQPHLEGFLRFADFSFGAEGGAASLVRTVRSLASAGVANRVVAIFDNDTAAADALKTLDGVRLPPNIMVMTYPQIDLATRYPTIGPTGPAHMNVNGMAGSIELYLGEDVLRDPTGDLRAVQWTGYIARMGRYQGELVDKQSLLKRFEAKAALARDDRAYIDTQDWSGLDSILDGIRQILAAGVDLPGR
ncbi:MAG: hypothetical protein C0506_09420 [Anaerolinea sp.]|nr:hypothetical protein [Anaerolinea sp.]